MEKIRLRSVYDDLDIAVAIYRPQGDAKAVLQLVHGMCGCKERFSPVMEFLSANGIACIASDHRGHGESVKSRDDLGYFYSGGYKALVEDLRMVTDWGMREFAGVPYYLLGHSMGSLAARIYAKYDDSCLDGLIVCGSPSWDPKSVIGRFITGILCASGLGRSRPALVQDMASDRYNRKFSSEGPQAWTCSDPEARRSFIDNPVCNFRFTMNGANNLMKMMSETYSTKGWKVAHPKMPIFFISGSDDPCMISESKFHKAAQTMVLAGYRNVSSVIYPKMRHEVLNEYGKQDVWNEILNFINTSNNE